MTRLVLLLVLALLVLAPTAAAHYGGIWFLTAFQASEDIIDRYPRVEDATCKPIPPRDRGRYPAHSIISRSSQTRKWDHFRCAVWTFSSTNGCWAVYHSTGQFRSQFVMTSYYYFGCGPRVFAR